MSAVGLLERVERFLRDQTQIVVGPVNRQVLEVTWQNTPENPLTAAIAEVRNVLSVPAEFGKTSRPDLMALLASVNAIQAGTVPDVMPQGNRYRAVWNLTDKELPVVARWLDKFDSVLAEHPVNVLAHKYVGYQWMPHLRRDRPEYPHAILFGVWLSRPRHIQVPFQFYDADHYWLIQGYLEQIDLARLIDKSVLPRGSLSRGTTAGAG